MPEDYTTIKSKLYTLCRQYVAQRIETARQAMEAAQESANSESKSSAGDKYETGRAMAQLERDRHAQLLAEAKKMEQELNRLPADKINMTVQPGSLVITDRGAFYISISAGKLTLDGIEYYAVSPASPIATVLSGKKPGDLAVFNTLTYPILHLA